MSADTTTDLFANRITVAIAAVDAKLADLDPDAIARLEATATMSIEESLAFGPIPSALRALDVIDLNAANTLHAIYTNFDDSTLAQRIVFMQTMAEALAAGVRG